jgi:putative membrane protein
MRIHPGFWTAALVLFLSGIAPGCQKTGVQAANDNVANPLKAAPPSIISDRDFLVGAEKTEVRERSLSQVAWDRALSADVKEFARAVIENHEQSLQRLRDLMNRKGLSQPPSVPEAAVEGTYRLDSVSGAAFDHQYISLMTAEIQQAIGRFKLATETATDPEVRAYAVAVLPVLESEQQKAADLEKKLAGQPGQ